MLVVGLDMLFECIVFAQVHCGRIPILGRFDKFLITLLSDMIYGTLSSTDTPGNDVDLRLTVGLVKRHQDSL